MTTRLTIGQIAKLAGVNIQTLRYYEHRRLLVPLTRKSSGYRLYDEAAVRRLMFIRNAQELGFTLEEISDLLALRVNNTARCENVKQRAQSQVSRGTKAVETVTTASSGIGRARQDLRGPQAHNRLSHSP